MSPRQIPLQNHSIQRATRWLLLALASCHLLVAHAESLNDAWAMAMNADGTLAAARSEREAAESDHTAAARQRWPSVDLTGGYTEYQHAPTLDISTPTGQLQARIWRNDGYAMAGADVSVPLWTSGRISGGIAAAAAGVRGAGAQETRTAADLKLAVTEAYIAVFRARKALEVAESNVTSLSAHADDVQAMYDKESAPRSDLLAAQVSLANATQQRLRAANAVHLATAAYNRWVGQPLERAPDLEEPSTLPAASAADSLDQLVTSALDRRPEIAAISAQQESLEQTARTERAQSLPQIALHAGYNHLDNQILDRENFASVGIGFQWRLYDSGQLAARTSALRSRAHAAALRATDLKSLVRLEVETAFYNRDEALARVRVAAGAVAQAEENVRIAKELYRSGLGTNNQVLDAESLRVIANTNRDDAAFDVTLAQHRLRRAAGEL